VQDSREDVDQRSSSNANPEPNVQLELSAEDAETLERLREAGLIDLQGIEQSSPDPQLTEWTYDEFRKHMTVVQKLKARTSQGRASTALNRVRYVKFLENHDAAPVQLRPPDEASWLDHVQYRKEVEDIAATALNQYRKALKSLLKFLGMDIWTSLDKPFEETKPHWTLPDDATVRRFWMEDLHENDYLAATYAHMFHFGFHTGVRPPSEIVALDVDDVDVANRRLVVTQVKKNGERLLREDVEPFVLSASNSKSLKNYLDNWRPRVATGDSDAFFLNTNGERFSVQCLGADLSELGKQIWAPFTPYTMRRWFATEYLIANDFNVYAVAEQLGDTVATVERHYLEKARARAAMAGKFSMKRVRGGSK